jgi:hypothetical protein
MAFVAGPAPREVGRDVAHDSTKPRRELFVVLQRVETLPGAEERFLRHVARGLGVAARRVRDRQRGPFVSTDERGEGVTVAALRLRNELRGRRRVQVTPPFAER